MCLSSCFLCVWIISVPFTPSLFCLSSCSQEARLRAFVCQRLWGRASCGRLWCQWLWSRVRSCRWTRWGVSSLFASDWGSRDSKARYWVDGGLIHLLPLLTLLPFESLMFLNLLFSFSALLFSFPASSLLCCNPKLSSLFYHFLWCPSFIWTCQTTQICKLVSCKTSVILWFCIMY